MNKLADKLQELRNLEEGFKDPHGIPPTDECLSSLEFILEKWILASAEDLEIYPNGVGGIVGWTTKYDYTFDIKRDGMFYFHKEN